VLFARRVEQQVIFGRIDGFLGRARSSNPVEKSSRMYGSFGATLPTMPLWVNVGCSAGDE
jgi:hypothetical protein